VSEVVIAGIGQTAVGEHWEISLRELAIQAMLEAMRDAAGVQPQALFVGNMLSASLSHQAHLGALLADFAGLAGIEAETVEAAGASGGAALRQGFIAVASGLADSALVVGVEKYTDLIGPEVEAALATSSDSDYEAIQGLTPTAQAALLTRRYQYEFHVPADGLAGFALNDHANGVGNPNAMFQKAVTLQAYQMAESVSEPLNLFDIAPTGDGAAALLLTRSDLLPQKYTHPLVRIAASATASDTLALHDRADPLWFSTAQLSIERSLHLSN
jgi:acetyl-CoA C-acetyltransferase